MLLGSHVSIAGGYLTALQEAKALDMDTIQIFSKNQRTWTERIVTPEEAALFKKNKPLFGVKQAFSHAIYLINLGTEDEALAEKSIQALVHELARCEALGLTHTVLHPGAAGQGTTAEGIQRIAKRLQQIFKLAGKGSSKILLENTAGQGTSIGGKLEHLAELLQQTGSQRLGVCIDTCHAFASGYDIRTEGGMQEFIDGFDALIGLNHLLCFHLNDSKGTLGSRLDRHEHIGQGELGTDPFRFILRHFNTIPKVLETSKENNADSTNLNLLRQLALR